MNTASGSIEAITSAVKVLAPDDMQVGDYVGVMSYLSEYASFFWCSDASLLPPDIPVRIRWRPCEVDAPLHVRAVCLPFVLVEPPTGKCRQLDTRVYQLAELDRAYARLAVKLCRRNAKKRNRKGSK